MTGHGHTHDRDPVAMAEAAFGHVRADLEVLDRDARAVRGERPFVFTNCFTGEGLAEVAGRIEHVVGRQLAALTRASE